LRRAAIVDVTVVDADNGAGLADVDLWERVGEGPQRQDVYFRSWEVATRIAWVERPRTDAHGKLRALVQPGRHRFGAGWNFLPPFYHALESQGREVECHAGESVTVKFAMRRR
jgi:hypothetical protein